MNPTLAIRYRLIAVLATSIVAALMRLVGEQLPAGEVLFLRSLIGLICLLVIFGARGELMAAVYTNKPIAHLSRGLCSAVAMLAYIAALVRLPLLDVTVIVYSTPIIAVFFSALILKESVRFYRWTAVVIGFIGVLMMASPYITAFDSHHSLSTSGAFFALFCAVAFAASATQIRRLTSSQTSASLALYLFLSCVIVSAITIPFGWVWPNSEQWIALGIVGFLGAFAPLIEAESYRHAEMSVTAPFDYTAILWAFVIGYLFFGEFPKLSTMIGAIVIISAGVLILVREYSLKVNKPPPSAIINS